MGFSPDGFPPATTHRQMFFRPREPQSVPFRFTDRLRRLPEPCAKLQGILQRRARFVWPMVPGVFVELRPEIFTQPPRGFRQEWTHQFQSFSQQDVRLKFQIGGSQLQKCRPVGAAEVDLDGDSLRICCEGIAEIAVAQQAAQRGDEINFRHGCAGVWRFQVRARPSPENLHRALG